MHNSLPETCILKANVCVTKPLDVSKTNTLLPRDLCNSFSVFNFTKKDFDGVLNNFTPL